MNVDRVLDILGWVAGGLLVVGGVGMLGHALTAPPKPQRRVHFREEGGVTMAIGTGCAVASGAGAVAVSGGVLARVHARDGVQINNVRLDGAKTVTVLVDGQAVLTNIPSVRIECGSAGSVETTTGSVHAHTVNGSITTTTGDVTVHGDLRGNVTTTSGSVTVCDVTGDVRTVTGDIVQRSL
jgi:hypothetical protein